MNFTIDDIIFQNINGLKGTAITTGGFELLGSDEAFTIGTVSVTGPGTVTVWRWENGTTRAQIERPNGSFEKVGA